jgi:hypothetical protein
MPQMTMLDLKEAVFQAAAALGGKASVIDIAKHVWDNHENDLRASGDRFYKWQYEMRWAAKTLRDEGRFASAEDSPKGIWVVQKN